MTSYHMSPEEFRANGHALIDWIARYMENVEQYPVMSAVEPGTIRAVSYTHLTLPTILLV